MIRTEGVARVLFLRGLRWRRGFSAAVLLVGVISAAVAVLGPLYARAAAESTLTDDLRAAGSTAGLAFSTHGFAGDTHLVDTVQRQIGTAADARWFGHPIRGESLVVTVRAPGAGLSTVSTMAWRDGVCGQITVTVGHCPTRPGEAIVPAASLSDDPHWRPGEPLTVRQGVAGPDGVVDGPVIGHADIVGAYRPRNFQAAYWFGLPYFDSQLGPAVSSAIKLGLDAIFVAPGQFATAPRPVPAEVDVDVPLLPTAVRLDDVPAVRRNVAALQKHFPVSTGVTPPPGPELRTGLPGVLDTAARDRREVRDATLVVVLELATLSLLVLFQVVGGAVAARGDEIALAKLRGLSPRRTVLFALGEPVVLLALAAPIGFGIAFGVAHALATGALVGGTPVAVRSPVAWALGAAFAGSALAAVLAAWRTLTRPVLEQWRTTSPPARGTRFLLVLDLVLAAAAVVAVVGLRLDSRARVVLLVAPALLVLAVALVGTRVLPPALRLGLRPTRAGRRIAVFLALRQTVRRPGGLRLATLLAVAAGLATFAVCGEAVAQGNRAARAQTEVGSARRLAVQFESGHDPESIVDAVDPRSRWALAAATWSSDGGTPDARTVNGLLLGVQPDRLPHVSYDVRGQLSPSALGRAIGSATVRPARFRGRHIRVVLDTTSLVGDHPSVGLQIRRAHSATTTVNAGTLTLGVHDYTAAVDCTGGCSFAGILVDRSINAQDLVHGELRVTAIRSDAGGTYHSVAMPLSAPTSWRSAQLGYGARATFSRAGAAIAVSFRATDGSSPILQYVDSPTVLPFVAAPKSLATPAFTGAVTDYSGTVIAYRVVQKASPLPFVRDTGAIADLDYLRIRLPNFDREASWSVWLGPSAPSDAVARLRRAGLLVQNVTTTSQRVAALGRQGPALGLLLLLVCAIAAAVLAVGGTAVSLLADARRRLFELAALRVIGVRRRTLRDSAVAEQALLLGAALVLGLPSGYVAAVLVLPVVPEFSDPTPTVLRFQPPLVVALGCALAFAILLGITAVVAGRALVRAAVPSRLRESVR